MWRLPEQYEKVVRYVHRETPQAPGYIDAKSGRLLAMIALADEIALCKGLGQTAPRPLEALATHPSLARLDAGYDVVTKASDDIDAELADAAQR